MTSFTRPRLWNFRPSHYTPLRYSIILELAASSRLTRPTPDSLGLSSRAGAGLLTTPYVRGRTTRLTFVQDVRLAQRQREI